MSFGIIQTKKDDGKRCKRRIISRRKRIKGTENIVCQECFAQHRKIIATKIY